MRLADNADNFYQKLEKPRVFAREVGAGLVEYLLRVLSYRAAIAEPKDLAWLLASYARDGLARVEAASDAESLRAVRSALEEALGIRFKGEKGDRFFYSTLVQTLFYGIFSAWVLWAQQLPTGNFAWRTAAWQLRAPVLRALFQQLSDPGRLQPLGLVEVLDWTSAALNRVDREAFFSRFNEGEAVPYFYEPFLAAFDPDLRKQLGVWYTPTEVVRYMVARVDKALKDDLGITDGLAGENVYVLDPCCGTGAYLAEVLRRIALNLEESGLGALVGARVKQAATERVFGFEIMPAPFVVAHLQVGLTMRELDAPLADDGKERPGVFLTNALTGWEPTEKEKQLGAFPEMAEERDRANRVKRDQPILVVLGNPPYNAFAGVTIEEERQLVDAYSKTRNVRLHESKGLVDLYIRFFRMAERRIAKTGQGVVCFISNYSWLSGLSFPGMRECFLDVFDAIRIDCLNGDVRKGCKTPEGNPDMSIFTVPGSSDGIKVGTAIATLIRKANHKPAKTIGFRHLWGQSKHEELKATAESKPEHLYESVEPILPLGLPFTQVKVSDGWFDNPTLPDLFPAWFSGAKTNRDSFLVDIDLDRLKTRIAHYFDASLSHDEIARRYPVIMKTADHFDARSTRDALLMRGGPNETGFVQFVYRAFDSRWLYWEAETKLLNDKRAEYKSQIFEGNVWLEARQREAKEEFSRGTLVRHFSGDFGNGLSSYFPAYLRDDGLGIDSNGNQCRSNLSGAAQRYLKRLGADVDDLFYHALATLHDSGYREANARALRMEWPRIPLPGWPDGNRPDAAETLAGSAARGRKLAQLLDPETPVPGVTKGELRPEITILAVATTTDAKNMSRDDFALTAGWGYLKGSAVMPGKGHIVERPYTFEERAALTDTLPTLGETTFDIYLNHHAYWRNVPASVWNYKLGGYQVLKKWLSYRERDVLERVLSPEEVQYFSEMVRRISNILRITSSEKFNVIL